MPGHSQLQAVASPRTLWSLQKELDLKMGFGSLATPSQEESEAQGFSPACRDRAEAIARESHRRVAAELFVLWLLPSPLSAAEAPGQCHPVPAKEVQGALP